MNLQLTFHHQKQNIYFLDIMLSGNLEKDITVSQYCKSTARNSILLATSCHPKHVITNLPVAKLMRMKRNCTATQEYIRTKLFSNKINICYNLYK